MGIRLKTCARCGEMDMFEEQLCPSCEKEMRELFVVVKHYVEDHPGSDVQEIVDAQGVEEKDVLFMLNHGWLTRGNGADDDRKRCTQCGIPIVSGKLCTRCMTSAKEKLRGVMKAFDEPAKRVSPSMSDDKSGMVVRARRKKD